MSVAPAIAPAVAVVDYGSGNLRSVANALAHVAPGREIAVTSDAETIARAERVVLPGVGAFGDCRAGLQRISGLIEALEHAVIAKGRPFLGVCVGMQLMARAGLEHGRHPGLGWLDGEVGRLTPADPACKIPHMGWNELSFADPDHPVFAGVGEGDHVYFVHSYAMTLDDRHALIATADHGGEIVAAVGRDNLVGTQFHPEKSQGVGLRLLENFLAWRP